MAVLPLAHRRRLGCRHCCSRRLSVTIAVLKLEACVVTPLLAWRETPEAPCSVHLVRLMCQVCACVGVTGGEVSCLCCITLRSCRLRSCPLSQSIVDQSICSPSNNKMYCYNEQFLNVLENLPAPVHHLKNHCFALQPSVFHPLIHNHHSVSSLNEVFCVPVFS